MSLLFYSTKFSLCFLIWLFPLSNLPTLGIHLFSSHQKTSDTSALNLLINFPYFRCQHLLFLLVMLFWHGQSCALVILEFFKQALMFHVSNTQVVQQYHLPMPGFLPMHPGVSRLSLPCCFPPTLLIITQQTHGCIDFWLLTPTAFFSIAWEFLCMVP